MDEKMINFLPGNLICSTIWPMKGYELETWVVEVNLLKNLNGPSTKFLSETSQVNQCIKHLFCLVVKEPKQQCSAFVRNV